MRTGAWARERAVVVVGLLVVGLVGCASRREAYDEARARPSDAAVDVEAVLAEADQHWALRESEAELRRALELYERVNESAGNRDVLVRLSRGYFLLADSPYLKGDDRKSERAELHNRGAERGEQALGLNEAFRARIEQGDADVDALDALAAADAPGLYWAWANLARWANEQGFTTILRYKSKLKKFIDRVAELDDRYFYGGAHRGLGAYYAKAPAFAGGDLEKAKEHFDQALQIEPGYIANKVLMAEFYAPKMQDRALFERLLEEAIAADPEVLPEVIPEQRFAQLNAQVLLGRADDLFE